MVVPKLQPLPSSVLPSPAIPPPPAAPPLAPATDARYVAIGTTSAELISAPSLPAMRRTVASQPENVFAFDSDRSASWQFVHALANAAWPAATVPGSNPLGAGGVLSAGGGVAGCSAPSISF